MREYCRIIVKLLPDHTWHHAKIRKQPKYINLLQDALIGSKASSLAANSANIWMQLSKKFKLGTNRPVGLGGPSLQNKLDGTSLQCTICKLS